MVRTITNHVNPYRLLRFGRGGWRGEVGSHRKKKVTRDVIVVLLGVEILDLVTLVVLNLRRPQVLQSQKVQRSLHLLLPFFQTPVMSWWFQCTKA